MQLVAQEAQAYVVRRYGDARDFAWADVKRAYGNVKDDGFVNTKLARLRNMREMFGAADPDLRALADDGKIWYDELSRMMGAGNKEKADAFAKKGGKADMREFTREFNLAPGSGGYSARRSRGEGPGSGGYSARAPPSARPTEEGDDYARGPAEDKATGTSKARRAGRTPKGATWSPPAAWSRAASSSPTWWSQDQWWDSGY